MVERHTQHQHHHDHHGPHFRFCPKCGGALSRQLLKPNEPKRLVCARCAFIFYDDPKVAACTIPVIQGKILLLQRGLSPAMANGSFPAASWTEGNVSKTRLFARPGKRPVSPWKWAIFSMPIPTPVIRSWCWCIRQPCSPASPRPWTKRWPSSSLLRQISPGRNWRFPARQTR